MDNEIPYQSKPITEDLITKEHVNISTPEKKDKDTGPEKKDKDTGLGNVLGMITGGVLGGGLGAGIGSQLGSLAEKALLSGGVPASSGPTIDSGHIGGSSSSSQMQLASSLQKMATQGLTQLKGLIPKGSVY